MKEVDCRKCGNLIDTDKGCSLYGSDADAAVQECAKVNFTGYTPGMRRLANKRVDKLKARHENHMRFAKDRNRIYGNL